MSLKKHIRYLEKEIVCLEEKSALPIKNTPSLKADKELLVSIPGIGDTTAPLLLAELPDVAQFENAAAVAAFAGLAPCDTFPKIWFSRQFGEAEPRNRLPQ